MMTRKIKFRAKALVNNKQLEIKKGDWVFGSYIESECDAPCIIFGDGCQIEIQKETLGQLTGVKDRFLKDIYEGDILTNKMVNPKLGYVIYRKDGFELKAIKNFRHLFESLSINSCDVVAGNIHDNCEILEKKK